MIKFLQSNSQKILSLHRYTKRIIVIITDIFLCIISLWIALKLSLEDDLLLKNFDFYLALISTFTSISIFWFLDCIEQSFVFLILLFFIIHLKQFYFTD